MPQVKLDVPEKMFPFNSDQTPLAMIELGVAQRLRGGEYGLDLTGLRIATSKY
jgi:hypothetical protein